MIRFMQALLLSVALVTAASADLGPRPVGPVPKAKTIPVNNILKYANEFPNHTFWAVTDGVNGMAVVPMKPDTTKPHPLTLKTVNTAVIYALPNDVAKLYDTPREFLQAIATGKLPVTVAMSPVLVKEEAVFGTDKRTVIDRVLVVSGGAKKGVSFTEEDPLPPKKGPTIPKTNEPEPDDESRTERPTPRLMIVGVASALAVAFAGIWLARRSK